MSQPPPPGMPPMIPDPNDPNGSYYPPENDLTGGLPINLDSLRDGPPGSKPFYPYSTLIRYAIKGSPNQKLLLEDIYYAIESRFPYFRTAPSGWKFLYRKRVKIRYDTTTRPVNKYAYAMLLFDWNSVRHNLSLNPCFEKVPRPLTDRGKGSYWTVNDNVDPRTGVHRVRKKKTKNGKGRNTSEEGDVDYHPAEGQFPEPAYAPPPPMVTGEANGERPPGPFPPAQYPPPFDPNIAMLNGMRFPPAMMGPLPITPGEDFEMDEHGQVNWRAAWLKEIGHLQQVTTEQEKAGADQEWYRMMLYRVRTALMMPIMNPADASMIQHMVPQPAPVDGQPQPPQ